jgi:hypothetical protein
MVRPVQRTARSTPALVDPPTTLLRVERFKSPLRYSQISAETAALDHAGHRFDVPGAGVLYAASTAQGAFAETTAHFRHSASLLERMARAGASADELAVPTLDRSWRAGRVLRMLRMLDALPFFDIEASGSHTYLTEHARSVLLGLGVPMLDVPTVRGQSRLLTRGLATWIYQRTDAAGEPLYGGIRYLSKLDNDYECWAIFDGTAVEVLGEQHITIDDPDLAAVAKRHAIPLK